MMLEVPFTISSQPAAIDTNQLVSFSIPFERSSVYSVDKLVINAKHQDSINITEIVQAVSPIKADFTIITSWPDGSIKWLQCQFISLSHVTSYVLTDHKTINETIKDTATASIEDSQSTIEVLCADHTYIINKSSLGFNCLPWQVELIDNNDEALIQHITNIEYHNKNSLTTFIKFNGYFGNKVDDNIVEFDAKLTVCHPLSNVQVDFTVRNTKPMISNGGKWDLGNENSFFFNACNVLFETACTQEEHNIQVDTNKPWQPFSIGNTLFQASSGGENWQSNNHVNANRKNTLAFKGYQFTNNTAVLADDLRATPSLRINTSQHATHDPCDKHTLYVHLKNFWQNFPKSIQRTDKNIRLGLFPSQHNHPHELQPGEQKTHTFFLAFNESTLQGMQTKTHANICPSYLAKTQTLPFFSANKITNSESSQTDGIDKIIQLGLSHKNNFFEKREQIDEFGWRNFGDIYADHETLEYQADENDATPPNTEHALISHYNNQYDPLYGFLRQYLLSNNDQWWQLAEDLAQHIKDIDIYHTTLDKVEYNQGLFWHTDHYLPAETATHRTYSKHQKADAYQDHAGGGGPGGQHCYTTGLALHYLLTGDETSKSTVINLAHWITHVYEGNGAFFDTLLKIKNREYPGVKNVITGQYPLDRGTGNYIVALIDAYQVSDQQSYLDQASLIIKNTASPTENLADRNLDNIEECWFYTVFLQAIGRYLQIKEQLNQYDESFYYAKKVLLHFAEWMNEHEQPYLTTPDVLEYPNHTWAAQDIRKANVLYLAAYYSQINIKNATLERKYSQKADSIYHYVETELGNESTHYFTRILSILMQNHGIKDYIAECMYNLEQEAQSPLLANSASKTPLVLKPTYHTLIADKKIWQVILSSLKSTSIKTELTWLRQRVKKIDNLLLKLGNKP